MAAQAKKTTEKQTSESIKSSEAGHDDADGNISILHTVDKMNDVTEEYVSACCGGVMAASEAGSIATKSLKKMQNEIIKNMNEAFSDYQKYTQDVLSCRTLNDFWSLQNQMSQQRMKNYFDNSIKICDMLFEACGKSSEPFQEQAAITSEHIRKALASG